MKKVLISLTFILSCLATNAQMTRWIMQPDYDKIYIASGAPFMICDSLDASNPSAASVEESYNKALVKLYSNNSIDVKQAVNIMDSLSMNNYAPAMYELARTYGWYSDSLILKRKDALGIDYYKDKKLYGMPETDKYNDKARDLYSKILELNDSTIAKIKANAAYRMATYYANENSIYGQNFKKAKDYLLVAREYAIAAKEDSLLMSINESIEVIDKKIK